MEVAILEYFTELKHSMKWWKVILFLLFTAYIIMVEANYEMKEFFYLYRYYWIAYVSYFLKPKISKLNYLLPGDENSRIRYLMSASVGLIFLFILWYLMIHMINIIMGNYGVVLGLTRFLCANLVFILIISFFSPSSSFVQYQKKHKIDTISYPTSKPRKGKVRIIKGILIIVLMIYAFVHIAFLSTMFSGYLLVLSTVISYLCIIPYVFYMISEIKKTNTGYENLRKPVKII